MSNILGANEKNFKEVIDRYVFVGIVEEMDKSVKILANLAKKHYSKIAWVNKTRRNDMISSNMISKVLKTKFKSINKLDYLIYKYAKDKLFAEWNNFQ